MNMFNTSIARNAMVAEGWVPEDQIETVYRALREASVRPCGFLYVYVYVCSG